MRMIGARALGAPMIGPPMIGPRMIGALTALAAGLAGALGPSLARADVFGPISLASSSAIAGYAGNQQADYAHDATISADGRYVAFDGSFGGRTGAWRRDLQTGVVAPVAAENLGEPVVSASDADLPSISANGRYVSFTTTARLDPADDVNPGPDVYVRDMTKAPSEEGAYTLASAVDGSSAGLSYEPTGKDSSVEFEEQHYGSVAAGRSALSADGRKVAFVTTMVSNLAGAGTPAMQVVVRDLDNESTQLVSVADDPLTGQPLQGQPVSGEEAGERYGAVYGGSGLGGKPPSFVDPVPYELAGTLGASISADGSTVAWMAVDVGRQARMLSGEFPRDAYTEPLWRRIVDGSSAPVRRVTGGSDPTNPSCAASGETVLPGTASLSDPCQGPFAATQEAGLGIWRGGNGNPIPRLSADGYAVAFLADAPFVAQGNTIPELSSNLYLVNMHDGLTRVAALRSLTELAGGDQQNIGENGPIEDVGISADGNHVAFTTKRTVFPLGSPAFISAPAAIAGMLELFDVDLSNDTLTRVSEGFAGGASEHPHEASTAGVDPYTHLGDGALSPSLSNGGEAIAFSSTASNLAFGDGNTPQLGSERFDGSDAFVVSRVIFSSIATPQSISGAPPGPTIATAWRVGVTARSRRDGTVLLYATVPGAGTLHAAAQSALRVPMRRHGRLSMTIAARSVASTKRVARQAGAALVTMALAPAARYRALVAKRPGLSSTVTVTFTAADHATLRQKVSVTFRRTLKAKAERSKAGGKSGIETSKPARRASVRMEGVR